MSDNSTTYPPPGKYGHLDPHDPKALWFYDPSLPAAILFCVLFGVAAIAHVSQAIMTRKGFCWVIIMAALWQIGAFVCRTLSTRHQDILIYYLVQQLLVLLAPLWTNAFCYMILGRMIHFFIPERKLLGISSKRFTLLFVLLDITAFLAQAGGASMASNSGTDAAAEKSIQLGLHIYMGGIGLQELFILIFVFIAYQFQRQMNTIENPRFFPWRPLLYAVYSVMALITIRIIYRLVEFSAGIMSTITMHEVFYYIFDALPMLVALYIFNIWHPGCTLVGPESRFEKEPKKAKKSKKRGDNGKELFDQYGRSTNTLSNV